MSPTYTRIEAVDLARQLEVCGEAWYDAALEVARAPAVRTLLRELRDAERAHRRTFDTLLDGAEDARGDWRQEEEYARWMRGFVQRRVFPDPEAAREAARAMTSDGDLLRAAIRFEQQTIEFLEHLRALVGVDDQDVIDELIAEEREHERALTARLE